MTFANEIAKNVRKICENVRYLTESAIKRRTPVAKMRRKETTAAHARIYSTPYSQSV